MANSEHIFPASMVASTESCPQFDGNNFVLLKIWLSSRKNQNVILVDLPLGVYMGPVTFMMGCGLDGRMQVFMIFTLLADRALPAETIVSLRQPWAYLGYFAVKLNGSLDLSHLETL